MYFIGSSWVTCQEASLEHAIFFSMRWFLLRGGSWKGSWLSNLSKEVLLEEISSDQCTEIRYINAQKFVTQCKERRYSMHKLLLHQRTENRYIKEQKFVI
jgi:hypothetical protein